MKLLMCPPLHYEPAPGEDGGQVMAEWRGLYRLLREELDVQVDLLEPRPGLPKLVLAAGGGFVREDAFVVGRPREAGRRPEAEAWVNFFLVRGYAMPALPEGCCFEGERDLVAVAGTLFAGVRSDGDLAVHEALAEMLGQPVRSLRLSDGWPWPLDTCLSSLGGGRALFLPEAFDPAAQETLGGSVPQLLPLDPDDARRFGGNALVADQGHAVLPDGCEATAALLAREGFAVHTLPLGSCARHGAGPKALVLKIED